MHKQQTKIIEEEELASGDENTRSPKGHKFR
jgi:hypothetical protein